MKWECDPPKYSPRYPTSSSFDYVAPLVVPVRLQDLPVHWVSAAGAGWVFNIQIYKTCIYMYVFLYIYIDSLYVMYYVYMCIYILFTHKNICKNIYIGTTKIILFFFDVIFCPKPAVSWFYCSWHDFAMQHCQKLTI